MKKTFLIIIGIAFILAVSCSHDIDTTDNGDDTTTVDTTDSGDNSSEPTIRELLQKTPASFKEFKDDLSLSRNTSRTALAENETQGFSTTQYSNIAGTGSTSTMSAILILIKNDISALDGFENGLNYNTIPENFQISDESFTEIETTVGWTREQVSGMVFFNTVKVIYENPNALIYVDCTMKPRPNVTIPVLILFSGVYNDRIYEEVKGYYYVNYGNSVEDGCVHYYKADNTIISTEYVSGNRMLCFVENETYDYYTFTDHTLDECKHQNTNYNVYYRENRGNNLLFYHIFDEDGYLVAQINDTNNSPRYEQVIPIHFINTNGHIITKEENSSTTSYYIDTSITSNIASRQFYIGHGSETYSRSYPCYIAHNSNPDTIDLSTDDFTFTKPQIVSNAIQKINEMKQTVNSSGFNRYFITDSEFNLIKEQCTSWANSL